MHPNNLFLRVRNSSLLWGMMAVFGLVALFGGLFFATYDAHPYISELAFAEYSKDSSHVGSVVPASSESVPPVNHFAGDIPIPPTPSFGSFTCNAQGTTATLSWGAVAGADNYYVRSVIGGSDTGNPANYNANLDFYVPTTIDVPTTPGVSYYAWIHSNNLGGYSAAIGHGYTCPIPAVGAFEAVDVNTCSVAGWAYDPDSEATSIDIHVYKDGSAGTGTYANAACTANIPRPSLGLAGNHGFLCTLPASYAGNGSHPLYIHAIDAVGGTNNVIGGSPRSLKCPAATLTSSSCEIPSGSASCNSNIVWSALDFNGTVNMQQNATTFSTAVSSGGTSRAVTPDNSTFTLRDLGSTFTMSRTAAVTCAANSVWVSGLAVCAPLPVIDITNATAVVRSGTAADLVFTVNSTYNLTCTIGDGSTSNTLTHTGSNTTQTYTETTRTLTSAQIVTIDCTHSTYPVITGSDTVRVNVIPAIEEI